MGEHSNDITQELALLHTLSGADFSRQVEVLVIKGHKRVSVKRVMAISDTFFAMFRKAYER